MGTFSEHALGHKSLSKLSSPKVFSFTMNEDTLPGTVVGKLELPLTSPTPITFSVLEDDGQNLFLLSPHSGEFLLSRGLDFETQSLFILSVGAQIGHDLVSSIRVYFNVLDVNDNPPVFSQDAISLSLQENMWTGACFLALNVSDKDEGENGELYLTILSGDEDGIFFINPSGNLCLNSDLDRERQSFYNLTVTANDCAQPPPLQFTSTAFVTITVEDINDNPPWFASHSPTVTISENSDLNATVITAYAQDPDSGSNGDVWYYLTNSSGGVFSIDNRSGTIYLQEHLDRENIDKFTISVTAVDKGSPQLSSTINVTIIIEDSNDHTPVFTQSSYSFDIMEDVLPGTSIFQVQAHDQDVGQNGQVRYIVDESNTFFVDVVKGDVIVMVQLDREITSNYMFILRAVDLGNPPREETATLNITILDVNDFIPRFLPDVMTIHVMENGDATQLTHEITALDEDIGLNSEMTYFIQTGNIDLFSISRSGTLLISNALDRETNSSYTLVVNAVDSGIPPLTGTLTVHVVVDDVNDNLPEFSEEAYHTIVSEDSTKGTVFAMITASDKDHGENGKIRYSVESMDAPFSIEEDTGELLTTDVLDREVLAEYRLTVIATDKHPTQPLSSSVLVTVLIGDVNDNRPQFLKSPYVVYMPSETEQAKDADTDMNAELRYSLSQQTTDAFSIDSHTGTVFTSASLTSTEEITLHVHVEDAGENPQFETTTITIQFRNVSEFPVMHVDIIGPSLPEDESVGSVVAMVTGFSSRVESVMFYLTSGNFDEVFQMDQQYGILTVQKSLDFEMKKDFILIIEARDSGSPPFSSFEEIHVNITDVNDNIPLFTQMEYRCEILENSEPTLVCDVLAIDADSESYGTVQYNITEGNSGNVFMINPENGFLSTTISLDRENCAEFNLTVEAVEWYNPNNMDRTTVIVTILDRNDNAPRFTHVFIAEVPEDAPFGHTCLHVSSMDDDTDGNSTYWIIDESNNLPFDIDFVSGYITVNGYLDREFQDHYNIKISANDSVWSASTDVTIIITDVNDNRPVFSELFYTMTFPETNDTDVFVGQVHAADDDMGLNGQILYVIDPPSEAFRVNMTNGAIHTKQPMSRQSANHYFQVTAYDCGKAPFHSNVTVAVRVQKRNLYPPMFLPIPSLIAIPYEFPEGIEVFQFTAVDQDENNSSANIQYVLNQGNGTDFFEIQPNNGRLKLIQRLPHNVNSFLILSIVAIDNGFPQLFSETIITLEITGKNTFSPSFRESYVSYSVPEDLPEGSVIGKCQAEDGDTGSNGAIMYFLHKHHFPFSIGEMTGLITLNGELDFENERRYQLQVTAKDGGWVSRTALLNVTVEVIDVNDNTPTFPISEFIAFLTENSEKGTVVLSVNANDADSGSYGHIVYSVAGGQVDKFAIDSRTGTITTLDSFDYEQHQTSFDLTVKAANPGGHSLFSLAHVFIQILDVNDFIPRFNEKEFYFSIPKNVRIGTSIGKVEATDGDYGPEGRVLYVMFGQNKYLGFDIHRTSGDIYTTGSLRKQGNTNIVLKVLAKNPGVISGTEVDEALVVISVINTNDAPKFTFMEYFVNVTEDSPVGTYVTTITALDQDSLHSNLFYMIQDGNTHFSFSVNPSNGIILISTPLDREQWPLYNLTLTATDFGFPPATGTTNVIVAIGDVNDNAPLLTLTEAEIKENLPQGSLVGKLVAIDSDLPPNQGPFTYWLVNTLRESAFSLTPDGVLFTTRPLDREKISVYQVLVAAKDSGIPAMTSTTIFQINILDENDNPPIGRNVVIEVKYFGSSFQGGMIGNVQPEDPDQSDTFTCTIKTGPMNMFSIANGSCELWSAPFQGEATYNITTEASDQLHYPVNNSVYVNYKGFMNSSVDNCILFYVSSSTVEEFLANKYLKFVKALDSLFNLQASKTHVFGIKEIGPDVLLLAAIKNYNGRYLSREVARSVSSDHKKLLESQSNVTFSHITSDPCLTIPCRNGATCNRNLLISQDVAVLQSPAVIFVAPSKEIFNCTCPDGFRGEVCEVDIDECEETPCENGATCLNSPGGFHCECKAGFSGTVCSIDIEKCLKMNCQNNGTCVHTDDMYRCQCLPGFEGLTCELTIDYCQSSPCVMGSCINFKTEFRCLCPDGVSGIYCEEQSYGFGELSYLEFPPPDRSTNLISLEFATVQKNALLVYCPGGADSPDFLAVEILDGTVRLTYDLGSGPVRLQTHKHVADGDFHLLSVRRIGSMGTLNVDNCTDVEFEGFCFLQTFGIQERTLDVGNMNMLFGGLRNMEPVVLRPGQTQTHSFVGCMRQIYVNGVQLRPSMALDINNIHESCPRIKKSPCVSKPCHNDGVCHDQWHEYFCECKNPFTGNSCNQEISEELVMPFSGEDFLEFVVKEHFRRDYLMKTLSENKDENAEDFNSINIKFKTRENGVLLNILGNTRFNTLQIKEGMLWYTSLNSVSGQQSDWIVDLVVSDGLWHVVTVLTDTQKTMIIIDSEAAFNATESLDLSPQNVKKVVLGGGLSELQQTGFQGCIQYFNISGYSLPLSGYSLSVELHPGSSLLQRDCGVHEACLSASCPDQECEHQCLCLHNISDRLCHVCASQNQQHCVESDAKDNPRLLVLILSLLFVFAVSVICIPLYWLRQKNSQRQKICLDVSKAIDGQLAKPEPIRNLDILNFPQKLNFLIKGEDNINVVEHFEKEYSTEKSVSINGNVLPTNHGAPIFHAKPLLMKPAQCLTFEEIDILFASIAQHKGDNKCTYFNPGVRNYVIDVSGSDTDTTCTCSDCERCIKDPNLTLFKCACFCDGNPYTSVGENITQLPTEKSYDCDMQSDFEETI
ncbi:protocadherin Fat 4 [Eucyclogobius newberryi]|uniref:protocadherin Fat 4 n=1 Tax=Eucyclogobius newberryi TaxID=166745 RepID=UPI003B5AE10A